MAILFNLRRLSAKTKVEEVCVQELLYADDSAFVAHSEAELQWRFNCFSAAAADFGLTINASKTEVMFQPPPNAEYHDPSINFNGSPLPTTKSFTYLGSTVTHDASLDKEISNRIQAAYSSFARLRDRLWHRHGVKLSTKIAVYRAIILPTLLYSSETYILYRRHIKRLSKVLQRQLRSIMGIRWHDRISNEEVLQRAGMMSLESTIMRSQLRWTGHVLRMNSNRLPRQTLYGELKTGRRHIGRPFLRFKDTLKRQLTQAKITPDNLEKVAANRAVWRKLVRDRINAAELERHQAMVEKRAVRHAKASCLQETDKPYACTVCTFRSTSKIGLWSHARKHNKN